MKSTGLEPHSARGGDCAFTRTDLLAIIVVVIFLGLILVSGQAATGRKAGMMECKNNLRQVGVAIDQYTRDHTNSLPGPIWNAAFYNYHNASGGSGKMATYLATYFGLPAPGPIRDVPALQCPAAMEPWKGKEYALFNPSTTVMPVYFWVQRRITNAPGNTLDWPFGRPGTSAPLKMGQIRRPSEQWASQDVDRLNDLSPASTYRDFLPQTPVHTARPGGNRQTFYRNNLYFDWSVRPEPMTN